MVAERIKSAKIGDNEITISQKPFDYSPETSLGNLCDEGDHLTKYEVTLRRWVT